MFSSKLQFSSYRDQVPFTDLKLDCVDRSQEPPFEPGEPAFVPGRFIHQQVSVDSSLLVEGLRYESLCGLSGKIIPG